MNTVQAPEASVVRLLSVTALALLLTAACGEATPVETDAGPGDAGPSDAGFDAGPPMLDAGLQDAGSDAALAPGACSNTADEGTLMTIDVAMEATTCGNTCLGAAMCVTTCMEGIGLSTECATCFGDTAQCAARMCALQCLGGDTPECTTCRRTMGCIAAFEACSGLPGS